METLLERRTREADETRERANASGLLRLNEDVGDRYTAIPKITRMEAVRRIRLVEVLK